LNPFVEQLVERMTLLEKIGQMTQADVKSLRDGSVRDLGLGSVLSGAGGNPTPNSPQTWSEMVRRVQAEALESRLGVPLLYGVDAVHGHNNVRGATVFPHNIGLGATQDDELVERIGDATARELLATNVHWTFAPALSVPQDIRWGRAYEGYSQDPALVAFLGAAFIRGLSGTGVSRDGRRRPVLASPKHFVGDGGTSWGTTRRYEWIDGIWTSEVPDRWQIDQGDLVSDEATLRATHLYPYEAAISAGAMSVMASYSSWNGLKLHAHRYLLTDLLKGEWGFTGFLVSDWLGVSQLGEDFETAACAAINAGIDMVMVPFEYERFIRAIEAGVASGVVLASRVEDACRRILEVKVALNLFADPFGDPSLLPEVGAAPHRALAREAVSRSQVLLTNTDGVLPLSPDVGRLLIAGEAADDIGLQCGGWTIEWQGGRGAITGGTTLVDAIGQAVSASTSVTYQAEGQFDGDGDVGIVVVSEPPYAEGEGDTNDLSLSASQVGLVHRVRRHCKVLVLVMYSGRPLIISDVVDACDAIIASWLPGTEAQGIADVLFGLEPFTGRLPHAWPRSMEDVSRPHSNAPLFPYLYGLTTLGPDLDRTHQAPGSGAG
jgi:beta-glucosidase